MKHQMNNVLKTSVLTPKQSLRDTKTLPITQTNKTNKTKKQTDQRKQMKQTDKQKNKQTKQAIIQANKTKRTHDTLPTCTSHAE